MPEEFRCCRVPWHEKLQLPSLTIYARIVELT
jgi:hypothetical protein